MFWSGVHINTCSLEVNRPNRLDSVVMRLRLIGLLVRVNCGSDYCVRENLREKNLEAKCCHIVVAMRRLL